ncbi:MAG: DUF4157 domain-containing protein [Gaiellaceae bacterium]
MSSALVHVKPVAQTAPPWPAAPRQAPIEVGRVDDPAEHEADRIATQLVAPAPHLTLRRCACGSPAGPDGECAQCKTRRLALRRSPATGSRSAGAAPAVVHNVLAAPGRPLDAASRAYFEPRLAVDLSAVRVHDDATAAASARAVGAHAYTVGEHIAFAGGRHMAATESGRRMLAHELVHVVQQREGWSPVLQRPVDCNPARLSMQECPPREPGEIASAASTPMGILPLDGPDRGLLVGNFAVEKSTIKANLRDNFFWKEFVAQMEQEQHYQWEILGFTDCEGPWSLNTQLRQQRATAVYALLPPAAKRTVTSVKGAEEHQCVTPNEAAGDRSANRSVLIRFVGGYRVIDMDPLDIKGLSPLERCQRGDPRVKTFPFHSSYFGDAPIDAERRGGKIHVEIPVHTWEDSRFRDDVRTLPWYRLDLEPDEIVRVHYYDKNGERNECIRGQEMLDVAGHSKRDTYDLGWKLVKKAWKYAKYL